jgi:hypothetical protein
MEIEQEELKGVISLKVTPGKTLDEFCEKNFHNYNPNQYEPVAIRFYYGKEVIVTLYALDKIRQHETTLSYNKLPVKKFKNQNFGFSDVIAFVEEFNFTLTTGMYAIEDMQVINK